MNNEYVHALGEELENCVDGECRLRIARILASSGSIDAAPYLMDALMAERSVPTRHELIDLIRDLEKACGTED